MFEPNDSGIVVNDVHLIVWLLVIVFFRERYVEEYIDHPSDLLERLFLAVVSLVIGWFASSMIMIVVMFFHTMIRLMFS
jgi:hypothetical protein